MASKMDPDTKNLCQSIVEEGGLDTLSTERIYTEYCKILMGLYPSQGLNFLETFMVFRSTYRT